MIEGRGIRVHPAAGFETPIREYRKTATVFAAQASASGVITTPEGQMSFDAGDYIVTDNPTTHAWPVKRDVFESTYVEVEP